MRQTFPSIVTSLVLLELEKKMAATDLIVIEDEGAGNGSIVVGFSGNSNEVALF